MEGRPLLEIWTWHGPTTDEGAFTQTRAGEGDLVVERFGIDAFATLRAEISAVTLQNCHFLTGKRAFSSPIPTLASICKVL